MEKSVISLYDNSAETKGILQSISESVDLLMIGTP